MNNDLKLKNQICFPLYVSSKEVIRKYTPLLDDVNLTYTQFIVMLVLFEEKKITVNELGKKVYLDSGTLTPLLKKLETKGYIERNRSKEDERTVYITLNQEGESLKEKCINIPTKVYSSIGLTSKELRELYVLLYKIINHVNNESERDSYKDLL